MFYNIIFIRSQPTGIPGDLAKLGAVFFSSYTLPCAKSMIVNSSEAGWNIPHDPCRTSHIYTGTVVSVGRPSIYVGRPSNHLGRPSIYVGRPSNHLGRPRIYMGRPSD